MPGPCNIDFCLLTVLLQDGVQLPKNKKENIVDVFEFFATFFNLFIIWFVEVPLKGFHKTFHAMSL